MLMEAVARITAKGQVTIPNSVRTALGLHVGDAVVFRLEGDHASMRPTRELIELAGSVEVPAAKRGTSWDKILSETRARRAGKRR
jgi:antitoxin PrlF